MLDVCSVLTTPLALSPADPPGDGHVPRGPPKRPAREPGAALTDLELKACAPDRWTDHRRAFLQARTMADCMRVRAQLAMRTGDAESRYLPKLALDNLEPLVHFRSASLCITGVPL